MLAVNACGKAYPSTTGAAREVLRDVSFELETGATLAVVGPSGCGKSTLLYMLCGLAAPSSGTILLDGAPILRPSPAIAIILQDFGLMPWKNALDNVALGLKIQGMGRRERNARARRLMQAMGLAGRENAYPACLSGGEQQRLAIARAYALSPRLLLMDEPFSSLDALTREALQGTLLDTWRSEQVPYVLVTHSVEEAVFLGRRILVLGGRPATVAAAFDNQGFGCADYRDTPAFFDMVRRVRRAMEIPREGACAGCPTC
ncbi:MAG: ABC transporter ATP-binding protein [Desulfovibrionaceae bacterium]